MILDFFQLLFLLVAAHAVADRPLQDEVLRAGKNRATNTSLLSAAMNLGPHGLIHGGAVALVLIGTGHAGLWWLGLIETAIHAAIDDAKCMGRFGLATDQALHFGCKVAWAAIAVGTAQ